MLPVQWFTLEPSRIQEQILSNSAAKMNPSRRLILMRAGKVLGFSATVLAGTAVLSGLGASAYSSTAAFLFLIVVMLSAFFGDFAVAAIVSIVAALCFDYFFLQPFGTLDITAFSDWIALGAFLTAAIIVSYLTAQAAAAGRERNELKTAVAQASEFGGWLLSQPNEGLTLSDIAKKALELFALDYVSIHVYGEGRWQHFSGAATSGILPEVEGQLARLPDHRTDVLDLADESAPGVRYRKIDARGSLFALLAVKGGTLPEEALGLIAHLISVRLAAMAPVSEQK
jgi:K+-sensing histidine kinase KdpD